MIAKQSMRCETIENICKELIIKIRVRFHYNICKHTNACHKNLFFPFFSFRFPFFCINESEIIL